MPPAIDLNDEDAAGLLAYLRQATQPVTTQQLIDALRDVPGTPRETPANS
jgi:hypothetical protein